MLELIIIVFVVFLFVRIMIIGRQLKGAHKRIDHIDETLGELKAIVGSPVSKRPPPILPGSETESAGAMPENVEEQLLSSQVAAMYPMNETNNEVTPEQVEEAHASVGESLATEPSTIIQEVEAEGAKGKRKTGVPSLDEKIKAWLFGGNTVARVGIVVLFFGVAFFLKYAADHGWLPVELRLTAAALCGMSIVIIGWRLRLKRKNYSLILQGGGTGIVYLTVFAAVALYKLIPNSLGLVLMVVLVSLSSALAVLQDARSLAVLAAMGGFLAPVLISRGGSHVMLFLYYTALDSGILAIAWYKAWRELNLLGFVFTFVIGLAWGYQYYQPEYFSTTQPFLVLFFLFYVAISILFAERQPINLKGYVDGTLVFGVPLIAFGLQSTLVRDFEYGLAISAFCAGIFYAVLTLGLRLRRQESMRMLTEVFLALAVVFATVAIPLAVDERWTGTAWALEGAALIWVGVRQDRWLARVFGLLVQLSASIAFLSAITKPASNVPVLNSFYLGALMVSVGGLFSAFHLYRLGQKREPAAKVSAVALVWGLVWWYGAGGNEIRMFVNYLDRYSACVVLVAASTLVLAWLSRRLVWENLNYALIFLLPAMIGLGAISYFEPVVSHMFVRWGLFAWLLAFSIQYWLLHRFAEQWPAAIGPYSHLGSFWLLVFIITCEGAWLIPQAVKEASIWRYIIWALIPIAVIIVLPRLRGKLKWPLQCYEMLYLGTGLAPLVAFIAMWAIHASFQLGDPAPIIYVPVINPLELSQLFVIVTALVWVRTSPLMVPAKLCWYAWPTLAFIVLNGFIARATHFLGNVPFDLRALWNSPRYQSTVSIVWTVAALLIMVFATRSKERSSWFTGAILLGAVVMKLFLVDLADLVTVARIVSFGVVGFLILLIGYFSPLPPKSSNVVW